MLIRSSQTMKIFSFALILLCGACAATRELSNSKSMAPPADRRGYFAEPEDFFGVYFKPNQPSPDGMLIPALSETLGDAERALEHDLTVISAFPKDARFRVVGFTDAKECIGRECVELSLRRAQLIHDWLISHGVSSARLGSPYGYGSARPIGDNTTESGRARNRRAYISDEK